MKKIVTMLLVAMLLLATASYAQNMAADPMERATKLTEWMKTNLGLNESQVTQVQAINQEYAQKNNEMHNSSLTKKQKMEAFKANEAARDEKLNQVFTPEQAKTYQSKKAEVKKQMKEKMKKSKKEGAPAGS